MSRPQTTNWPTLVKDGAWRETKHGKAVFHTYMRRRGKIVQCIEHDPEQICWHLKQGLTNHLLVTQSGTLDFCLLSADT